MATTIIGLGIDPKPKGDGDKEPRLEVVKKGTLPLPAQEQPNGPAELPKVIVDLTDDSPAQRRARRKWQTYDDIGLPPPDHVAPAPGETSAPAQSWLHKSASKVVVSAYRLMGFGILTVIVVALVSYIASTLFYYGSHTWLVPTAISTSDEKVVQLRSELAAQQNTRDKIAADLTSIDKAILAERAFQNEYAKAIAADVDGRRQSLEKVRELAGTAASTRTEIRSANDAFASEEAKRAQDEYKAGLIDRNGMIAHKQQMAGLATTNLGLAEKQADYERQAQELELQTNALQGLISGKGAHALSYDVLKIKRDYDSSQLEVDRDIAQRDAMKASLQRVDAIIAGLKKSAYLRALDDQSQVAMVPYSNVGNAKKGTPLYACRIGMLWCHQVGTVAEVLPSEVQVESPHGGKTQRGLMVELKLDDPDAAREDVLFTGGKPLGF
jgi:hypothetical protein